MLCAFASAFAQTAASRVPQPTPGANLTSAPQRCTTAPAQEGSSQATAAEQNRFAQRFVDERLAVWRQRLKLQDWQISAVMTPQSALSPKTLGGISWDKIKKTAVILVLNPSDYQLPFCEMLDDMEVTVVHELVHLELSSLPRSTASRGNEERAVNGIADAMLALDRQQQ
jgi:hypothetical protein